MKVFAVSVSRARSLPRLRPTITDRSTGWFGIYTALRPSVKAAADVFDSRKQN